MIDKTALRSRALEVLGRDIYLREGCYNCHSQLVRPFRFETERYGEYSKAGEFVYDHPFQWGSKRTGPDLARVGGRYSDDWHRMHLLCGDSLQSHKALWLRVGTTLLVVLMVAVVGLALLVAPFACGWPDGLESVAAKLGFGHRAVEAMVGAPAIIGSTSATPATK